MRGPVIRRLSDFDPLLTGIMPTESTMSGSTQSGVTEADRMEERISHSQDAGETGS